MLGREERHDPVAWHVASKIGHQMAQVVFLRRADGVVGEKNEGPLLRETAHRVIRVDPGVPSFACGELGTRRTQLRTEHGCAGSQGGDQIHLNPYYTMHLVTSTELGAALARVPSFPFAPLPSPVEPLLRLSAALGGGPRLLVKRDDAIGFAFGGNKVRKLALVAARARAVGASTPLGALGFVSAVAELLDQIPAPDVIVHATSSGGTQAGLVAGCRLLGLSTRILGISADDEASWLQGQVQGIVGGIAGLLD